MKAGMVILILMFLVQSGGTEHQNKKNEMHQESSKLGIIPDNSQRQRRTRYDHDTSESGDSDGNNYKSLETLVGQPFIISHKHIGSVKDGLLLVVSGDGTYTECQLRNSSLGCHHITTFSANPELDKRNQNIDYHQPYNNDPAQRYDSNSRTVTKSHTTDFSLLQESGSQLVMPLTSEVGSIHGWGGNITAHSWGVTFTLWHTFKHPGMYQILVVFTERSSLHPTWRELKSVQVQDIFTIWTGGSHPLRLDNDTTGVRASSFVALHSASACSKEDTDWRWDFHDVKHESDNYQAVLEEWQQVEVDEMEELQKELMDTVHLDGQRMESLNTGIWSHHLYRKAGSYDFTVSADCYGENIGSRTIKNAFKVVKPIKGLNISVLNVSEELSLELFISNGSAMCSTRPVSLLVSIQEGSHLQEIKLHTGDGKSTKIDIKNLIYADPNGWSVQVVHQYDIPGNFRPWLEVTNPIHTVRSFAKTRIRISNEPTQIVLDQRRYLLAVEEEVTFVAYACGGHGLVYNWTLPQAKNTTTSQNVLKWSSQNVMEGMITVSVHAHLFSNEDPDKQWPQAHASVSVVVGVSSVDLELRSTPGPHIIEVNDEVHLLAQVLPREAVAKRSTYIWDLGGDQVSSFSSHFIYYFPVPGPRILKVTVLTEVSRVSSAPLVVNVVERLLARGIADHDSVMVHHDRDFTVLVDRGSDIGYTWDFGDNSTKVVTRQKTVSHKYEQPGVFNLSVYLHNPLGSLTLSDKVFVLTQCLSPPCLTYSHCHTPKVPRIFPTDDQGTRKFEGGQNVLLEPTVVRDCPMGLGPQYQWQLFNEEGQSIQLPQVNFTQPTLLIMPYTFGRGRPKQQNVVDVEAMVNSGQIDQDILDQITEDELAKLVGDYEQEQGHDHLKEDDIMPRHSISGLFDPIVHPTFKGGVYQAQFTIQEKGTPVYFTIDTTFEVIGTPLRANFLGGYKRNVDPVSNITLQVEVLAPYPNYTISWECNVSHEPSEQCFKGQDSMDGFSSSIQHLDNLLVRFIKMIHGDLHSKDNGEVEGLKSVQANITKTNNITSQHPDRSEIELHDDINREIENKPWHWGDHKSCPFSHRYVSTITVPISALVPKHHQDFVFSSKITNAAETVNDQQLITINRHRSHNVGIIRHIGAPLGAAKRLVFESECLTCSEEDMDNLLYTWDLKMVVNSWQGPGRGNHDDHSNSTSRQDRVLEAALRNGQTAGGFIARPRDYRRVDNRSNLTWWDQQLAVSQKYPSDEGDLHLLKGGYDKQNSEIDKALHEVGQKFGVGADVVNRARDIVANRMAHKQQRHRIRRTTSTERLRNLSGSSLREINESDPGRDAGAATPNKTRKNYYFYRQMMASGEGNTSGKNNNRQLLLLLEDENELNGLRPPHTDTNNTVYTTTNNTDTTTSASTATSQNTNDLVWLDISRSSTNKDSSQQAETSKGRPIGQKEHNQPHRQEQMCPGCSTDGDAAVGEVLSFNLKEGPEPRLENNYWAPSPSLSESRVKQDFRGNGGRVLERWKDEEGRGTGQRAQEKGEDGEGDERLIHSSKERDIYGHRQSVFEDDKSAVDNVGDDAEGSANAKEDDEAEVEIFQTEQESSITHSPGPEHQRWSKGSWPSSPGAAKAGDLLQRRGRRPPPQWGPDRPGEDDHGSPRDQPQFGTQSKDQREGGIAGYENTKGTESEEGSVGSRTSVQKPGLQVKYVWSDGRRPRGAAFSGTPTESPAWPGPLPNQRWSRSSSDDLHNSTPGIAKGEGGGGLGSSSYGRQQQQQHDEAPTPTQSPPQEHTVLTKTPTGQLHALRGHDWSLEDSKLSDNDASGHPSTKTTSTDEELQRRLDAVYAYSRRVLLATELQQETVPLLLTSETSTSTYTDASVKSNHPLTTATHDPSRIVTPQKPSPPPGVLDYQKFKRKLNLAQIARSKIGLHPATSKNVPGDIAAVPPIWPTYGLLHYGRSAPGSGGGGRLSQGLHEGHSQDIQYEQPPDISEGRRLSQDLYKEQELQGRDLEDKNYHNENSSAWRLKQASNDKHGGVVPREPGRPTVITGGYRGPYSTTPFTGRSKGGPVRDINYQELLLKYGRVPNFSCRPEFWDSELCLKTTAANDSNLLAKTLGRHGNTDSIMRTDLRPNDVVYLTEQNQVDVFGFWSFTSTGIHSPMLVLYTTLLDTGANYMLELHVNDTQTGLSGLAKEDLVFSPLPILEGCEVVSLNNGISFHASCSEVRGTYYPVSLQFYYYFQRYGTKTLFYHGAQTSIEFTLPSGMENNDYLVYVSLQAMDGKGVKYTYPKVSEVHVPPRGSNGDDVLSIFLEISSLENESPSLLLQKVRSLAWELNIIQKVAITQQIFDNIYARIKCPEYDSLANNAPENNLQLIRDFDILISCARDHLTQIVLNIPARDEMETIQVLTALTIIIDADEFISSKTFDNTVAAMTTSYHDTIWDYNTDLSSQVAKEFFTLISSVLDKQTELIDQNQTTIESSKAVIKLLLDVMNKEVKTRFLEEEPLEYSTSSLAFHGYLADRNEINRWSDTVPFRFLDKENIPFGVLTILSIVHQQSPYMIENDPIKSEVLNVHANWKKKRTLQMHLKRSKSINNDGSYDFRRPGVIKPESISVYKFYVNPEKQEYAFHVQLQIQEVTNNPISAKILICTDLESLSSPLYNETVEATEAEATLFLPRGKLSNGKYFLIIIDTLSYDRLIKSSFSDEPQGSSSSRSAEFLISAWWSRCLPWSGDTWDTDKNYCNVTQSSWDYTNCTCCTKSDRSVYGVTTIPILTEEDNVPVNQLMLQNSYAALYFIILMILIYVILAVLLQATQEPRLKLRNIWLRDNTPQHDHAYLITIKTGAQQKADTKSKVYVILHGTHGMSATRELQSQQTGQLFTRGSICSFILTTPSALGEILKVQVWHDNSGGEKAGWFICEVSVSDLVSGATFTYPCYRWLSVSCEDARVEREITLETPTTFWQDLENFLPQYASEHILWSSTISPQSNHVKLYRLQRLTVCLIIGLCMGAVSLGTVKQINSKHTMMTPDLHIEPLFYGLFISVGLLALQGLLDGIFKNINKMEEREMNTNMVLDTLKAVMRCKLKKKAKIASDPCIDENVDVSEVYDPSGNLWQELSAWAENMELSDSHRPLLHPAFRDDIAQEMQIKHRRPQISSLQNAESVGYNQKGANDANDNSSTVNQEQQSTNKKCTPRFWDAFNYLGQIFKLRRRRRVSANISHLALFEGIDEDLDDEDELYVASSPRLIVMQCMGWMLCCFIIVLCISSLVINHTGMTRDYSAPWMQILYLTVCFYIAVMQPLVTALYTVGVVVMYRWFGSGDCITTCVGVPLDQVVAIWRQYQTLLDHHDQHHQNSNEKLLEERKRSRDLRFAHPPKEDYLFKCREKELNKNQVKSFMKSLLGHLSLLVLLLLVMSNFDISQRYLQNSTNYKALINGTCLENSQYLDPCSSSNLYLSRVSCNQNANGEYMRFQDIKTKDDWWQWAYSELLELVYNKEEDYSTHKIFCNTNSIIVGMPRLRKYDVNYTKCEASEATIPYGNSSFADLLKISKCFPDYVDNVLHTSSFRQSENKTNEWDTHYLGITYGLFSHYSKTPHNEFLPDSKFSAIVQLVIMQLTNWLDSKNTRAVITEFTLYNPQSRLYSTINLIAEFPSLSGAKTTAVISSTNVERYSPGWGYVAMFGEIILVAIAMYYMYKTCVYLYMCKLRFWNSFWGMLDILMMVFGWSYFVCLMLRVQIAEDIQWQLKVSYFQKFVNIKSLTTWDEVLEALIGMLVTVHLLRCLRLMRFNARLNKLGLVIAAATKDVAIITISVVVVVICLVFLGNLWFGSFLFEFHSLPKTLLTLIRAVILRDSLFKKMESNTHGWNSFLSGLYYFLCWLLLFLLTKSFYKAAFIYALKKHKKQQPRLSLSLVNMKNYFAEVFGKLYSNMRMNWAGQAEPRRNANDEPRRNTNNEPRRNANNEPRRSTSEEEVARGADVQEELGSDDDCDNDSDVTIQADTTPPAFYISELEQQLNQVMARLPQLSQSLGIIDDAVEDALHDEVGYVDKPFLDTISSWHPEQEFVPGRVKSSTFKTELEAMLEPLQNRVREVMQEEVTQMTEKQNDSVQSTTLLKTTTSLSFNLDAFADMMSCHTEHEAAAQSVDSFSASLDQATASTLFNQDGSQLAKFLRDVTAASEESLTLPSYGKYGRTFSKIKQNSTLERNMLQNTSRPHESLLHPQHDYGYNPSPTNMSGSKFRRTQTQGRGKGHVDALDIEALELDSDNESTC